MIELVQALVGWALTWTLILALMFLGYAVAGFYGPLVGLLAAGFIFQQFPEVPAGASWTEEYSTMFEFYHSTFTGVSAAVGTLIGVWKFIKQVTREEAPAAPAG